MKDTEFVGSFKPGDVVDYHSIVGGPVTSPGMVVRHVGYSEENQEWVAWLEGKAGFVSFDALTKSHHQG